MKRQPKPITPEQLAEFAKLKEITMRLMDESIPANKKRMEKARMQNSGHSDPKV
jgi:hypothetical protein